MSTHSGDSMKAVAMVMVALGITLLLLSVSASAGPDMLRVEATLVNEMDQGGYFYPGALSVKDFGTMELEDDQYNDRINAYSCTSTFKLTHRDVDLWPYEWHDPSGGGSASDVCRMLHPTDDRLALELGWSTRSEEDDPRGDYVEDHVSKSVSVSGVRTLPVRYVIRSNGDACIETYPDRTPDASFASQADMQTVEVRAHGLRDECGDISSVTWHWGDGSSGLGTEATHTYDKPGDYEIQLVVKTSDEERSEYVDTVTIDNRLNSDFIYEPDNPIATDSINFDNTSSLDFGSIQSLHWNFGDGNTSSEPNPSHTYRTHGWYDVSLTVVDSYQQEDSITKSLYVDCVEPVIEIERDLNGQVMMADATGSCLPGTNISSFSWSWANGQDQEKGERAVHRFDEKGTYNVRIDIRGLDGTTAHHEFPVEVTNFNPTAETVPSETTVLTSKTVDFDDLSTDQDGSVEQWHWDFGDGTTSNDSNPTHSYTDDGVYTVRLTVTDDEGATNATTREIVVENRPPQVSIASSIEDPKATKSLTFSAEGEDPDGEIVEWTWSFDDGTTATGQTVEHEFDEPGNYEITLAGRDDDGEEHLTTMTLEVAGPPIDYWEVAGILGLFGLTSIVPMGYIIDKDYLPRIRRQFGALLDGDFNRVHVGAGIATAVVVATIGIWGLWMLAVWGVLGFFVGGTAWVVEENQ